VYLVHGVGVACLNRGAKIGCYNDKKKNGSCDIVLVMALRRELEAWTRREWRRSRLEGNHIVVLTKDHCLTRFFIRSLRAFWHRSQAKCSDSGSKADSNVLVDKSGLASHAR